MAEAVTSLRFAAARPPLANGLAVLVFPLAHHLRISSARTAASPFPRREEQGHTPLALSEGRLRHVLTHDTEPDGEPIARPFTPQGVQEPASAVGDDFPR